MSRSRSANFWRRARPRLVLGLSLAACKPAPSVQVLGESTRLPSAAASPRESALFDGERIRLRGARGETLGLQLRVTDGVERRVRLRLPERAAVVSSFSVGWLDVKQPSTDMYGPSSGVGRYPDVLEPSAPLLRTRELAYFDVELPRSAEPGRYAGELLVGERVVPVELTVSSARIDLYPEPLVWVFYLPVEIARAHGLPDGESPQLIEQEARYHALFRAHGALLAADLVPARFAARRGFMRDVKYWPVAIDSSSDAAIERDVQSWLEAFRGSGVTPFTIPIDEPRTEEARQRVRHIGEVMGRVGGRRPDFLRAVTDFARPSYGDSVDVFISPQNFAPSVPAATGGVRYWTYNGRPPQAGSMILDTDGSALRTWGWIAERYAIELWYAWEGLYFSDRYNRGGPTDVMRDPITFDERSRGGRDFGNGDGLLAYPGPRASLRLKALRRGLQDRLLLRELAACAGAERVQRIVRRAVPRALGEGSGSPAWSIEEPAWERSRNEVLDAIERECHGPAAMAE